MLFLSKSQQIFLVANNFFELRKLLIIEVGIFIEFLLQQISDKTNPSDIMKSSILFILLGRMGSFIVRKTFKSLGNEVTIVFESYRNRFCLYMLKIPDSSFLNKMSELVYHIPCADVPVFILGRLCSTCPRRQVSTKVTEGKVMLIILLLSTR